ncbi:MAG: tetratricopeptide repeat protein [Methylophilaceae bacterium]|nr:MAG: tetratricopeptide repeat protein [Methylophilaceae bacterium]
MALDLDDQEQLDELKLWWNKYGKMTISLVLLALIIYASWQGYQYVQHKKAVEASEIYQSLGELDPSKVDDIKALSHQLTTDYAGTPYAGRAAVLQARSQYIGGDIKGAKSQLEWAVVNATETSIKAVASLQLARVLLADKDYAGAEKVLSAEIDAGYIGLKDDLLGDVLLAQGKIVEAKERYTAAIANLDSEGRFYMLTKQKLQSLGS